MPSALSYNGHIENDGKLIQRPDAHGEINSFSEYLTKVWLPQIKPSAAPVDVYDYRDINTELLGLAVARASGMPLPEYMETNLWQRVGFTSATAMYVNVAKDAAASGALNMTTRDFAIGSYLMVNGGKNWKGERVLPKKSVDQVLNGDDQVRAAWPNKSYEALIMPNAFYKNQWRTVAYGGRTFSTMIGVNGQYSAFDHATGAYREPSGQTIVMLYVDQIMMTASAETAK